MPDPYRNLTRAVVEIATQARRIADAMQTPVVEHADDVSTTPACDLTREQLVEELARIRRALDPDDETYIRETVDDQLALSRRVETLRHELEVANDVTARTKELLTRRTETLRTRAERAEQQRAQYEQEAVAATQHVLELKATIGRVREVHAWLGRNYPGFTEPASRLFVALQPQPATEEQQDPGGI